MAPKGYSRIQIALHWVVLPLIAVNLVFEDWIETAWEQVEHGGPALYDAGALAHIGVGVAVLVLALWRLGLRLGRGVPDLPAGNPPLMRVAAHLGHWALYAAMIGVPVVGLMAWFGASEDLAELHELGKPVFLLLIAGHVAAAVWHQVVLKDGLMARMKRAG